jgi:outer membrane protein assembly factor BamB
MDKDTPSADSVTTSQGNKPDARMQLRVWPGVAAVVLMLFLRLLLPIIDPDAGAIGILGGAACSLLIIAWWLLFSRARWFERVGAVALMAAALFAAFPLVDTSVSGGMMGMMLPFYAIPTMTAALVAAAVVGRGMSDTARRVVIAASIVLASGFWTLVRTDGILGAGSQLTWRWTKTSEERLLAQASDEPFVTTPGQPPAVAAPPSPLEPPKETPAEPMAAPASPKPAAEPIEARADDEAPAVRSTAIPEKRAEWPGFRGPDRDSIVHGVRIETDWTASPPVQLWRRAIGPGWSSFAVRGDVLYTQEQRGDDELVASYKVTTGAPVWRHRDAVRFWESNGGAGPRGTPTLGNGRVYTFGATGVVNALDARTGAVIWSRNAGSDTQTEVPGWGFASSPLVMGDEVVIAASGRLIAYDVATGHPRWLGPPAGGGYSSPHLMTIDGVQQIVLSRGRRTTSVAPTDGSVLWEHSAPQPGVSIVQPAFVNGDLLIAGGDSMGGSGIRRVAIGHSPSGWNVEERWESRGLKPYFNDFVVHNGYTFGFDGNILSCISLEDGARKWKGGRYGNGQMLLLADQDLLLVLSEEGELALVSATPDQFKELARFQVLDGKTWNHPALVGDTLLVRNGQEMAAFRLALAR